MIRIFNPYQYEIVMIIVSKFGGTSMADFESMQRCAEIVASNPDRKIIVVSATAGTTNDLVLLSENPSDTKIDEALENIKDRHLNIISKLPLDSRTKSEAFFLDQLNSLKTHLKNSEKDKKWIDTLLSFGELMSSPIFTEVVKLNKVEAKLLDARGVITTDDHFGNAEPKIESISERASGIDLSRVSITQGFIGSNNKGETTTLGRGGSDYSAALFAESVKADVLEIWTDVSGVYTTDPRIVSDARPIHELTFDEAAELSTFGGKVLHPATLKPAIRSDIKVFVGSSIDPGSKGTWIVTKSENKPAIRAISLRKNQTLVTVRSLDMLHRHGFLAHLFKVLADHKVSVDLVTTSEVSVSLTLDTNHSAASKVDLSPEIIEELESFSQVEIEKGLSLIALIGNQLEVTAGVSGSIFHELKDVNIRLICHGASTNNICFLVEEESAEGVVKMIHQKFIK